MIKQTCCCSATGSPRKWRFLLPQALSCQAPWDRGQRGITLQPARLSGDCCTPWARCDQQIQDMPVPQSDPQLAWGCISGLQQERSMCAPLPVAAQSTTLPSLSGRQVGLGVWGRRSPVEAPWNSALWGMCCMVKGENCWSHSTLQIASVWIQFIFRWWTLVKGGEAWVRGRGTST